MSLRQKGLLAFLSLLLYAAGLSAFVLFEKESLLAEVAALRDSFEQERLVNNELMTRVRTLAAIQVGMLDIPPDQRRHRLAALRNAGSGLDRSLANRHGGELIRAIDRAYSAPTARNVSALHDPLAQLETLLSRDLERIRRRESGLLHSFNDRSDQVAAMALVLGLLGVATIGFVSGGFLNRMTRDLSRLETGAAGLLEVDAGPEPAAGEPVRRSDEVGRLGTKLNHVARALREREFSEELNRRRHFHHEKATAVSSLASGIIHEIGNPLSIISDQTQLLRARCRKENPDSPGSSELAQIEQQLERINQFVREIADFSAPDSDEAQLLDLNHLVAAQFQRVRHESQVLAQFCRLQLDRSVPAVHGIAEQIGQVLVSLLMNAVDAVHGLDDRLPEIVVLTRNRGDHVELRIDDNGHGMDAPTLARAFDKFFTTKPDGLGSGLGLALSRSIVEAHGGGITIESVRGSGTRVLIRLPIHFEPTDPGLA